MSSYRFLCVVSDTRGIRFRAAHTLNAGRPLADDDVLVEWGRSRSAAGEIGHHPRTRPLTSAHTHLYEGHLALSNYCIIYLDEEKVKSDKPRKRLFPMPLGGPYI